MGNGDALRDPVVVAHSNRFLGLTKTGFIAAIVVLLLVCAIALGTFAAYEVGQNRKLATRGAQAQTGLCALEADLVSRIRDERTSLGRSRKFLLNHPNGIPGIPAALIKQGIATQERAITGQQSTVVVLNGAVTCPTVTSPSEP